MTENTNREWEKIAEALEQASGVTIHSITPRLVTLSTGDEPIRYTLQQWRDAQKAVETHMNCDEEIKQLKQQVTELEAIIHASGRLLASLTEKVALLLADRAERPRAPYTADDGLSRH